VASLKMSHCLSAVVLSPALIWYVNQPKALFITKLCVNRMDRCVGSRQCTGLGCVRAYRIVECLDTCIPFCITAHLPEDVTNFCMLHCSLLQVHIHFPLPGSTMRTFWSKVHPDWPGTVGIFNDSWTLGGHS
jgi:hypothetical protein